MLYIYIYIHVCVCVCVCVYVNKIKFCKLYQKNCTVLTKIFRKLPLLEIHQL